MYLSFDWTMQYLTMQRLKVTQKITNANFFLVFGLIDVWNVCWLGDIDI